MLVIMLLIMLMLLITEKGLFEFRLLCLVSARNIMRNQNPEQAGEL